MRSLVVLATLVFTTAASSAPVPKDVGQPVLYFSVREGDQSVFEVTGSSGTYDLTETVTKVVAKDGCMWVTVERRATKTTTVVYQVSAKGVSRVATNDQELAEPHALLKVPTKAGDTWTAKADTPTGPSTVYTAGKEEKVDVPAGKFMAIPIEGKITAQNGNGRIAIRTSWYAPNVGIVKMVYKVGDGVETRTLKSFKPGK
ncbi:hypothetical protein R5W24_000156 [Gemmata sp. JC717]|uniref:hypothetical protein n=1 Tax=Gemmata algarum TaxID=2975278 RepID=UPI0021BB540B|nr:hypothetical protein [Gemmata algarum]MDY3551082.1 hypothetical protein [Gemmata algarum]